jgi:phage repressor protein C with HTH and peptisase S24 domain
MSTTLRDRLRARSRQLGITPADLATLAGLNRSFVYDILRARSTRPDPDRLTRIAEVLKVDRDWLLHGVGEVEGLPPPEDLVEAEFVAIAYVAARPSMGGGAAADEDGAPVGSYWFRRSWIRNALGTAPSRLRLLQVEGDSMLPTLEDGDTVLLDMSHQSPSPAGIFVLHDGLGLVAKRVEHVPMSEPARLRIISDNPRYGPYECLATEVSIVGRIRWFAREL